MLSRNSSFNILISFFIFSSYPFSNYFTKLILSSILVNLLSNSSAAEFIKSDEILFFSNASTLMLWSPALSPSALSYYGV
jgi:hypothetical protein